MKLTLEWMFTAPEAFGVDTATPVQRAICRVADGRPLDDLEHHPDVVKAFGGAQAVARLPRERPAEVDVVAGIRTAKSLLCAAVGAFTSLTCDLSMTRPDEPVQVPILSTKMEKAKIVFKHLVTTMERKPALRALIAREPTTDRLTLRRPQDGRMVDILVTAGARAGGAVVSYWCAAVIFDEAARMNGEEDGVINFDETRTAALGRILPGGQIWAVTSPHAPRGPIYKAVQQSFGKPSVDLVVVRATGPMMNPYWWTPKRCKALRDNPNAQQAYRTDVLGEFAEPITALFTSEQVKRAARPDIDHTPQDGIDYGAAMDPGTRSNAWTLVIAGYRASYGEPTSDNYRPPKWIVAFTRQWQGSKDQPLKAKEVFCEMALDLKQYGVTRVFTDQWGFDPFREIAEGQGIELVLDERTPTQKVQSYTAFQTKLVADPESQIELPPDPVVHADLLSVRKRLTPNGAAIDLPETGDGRHADFAPAVVMAVEVAATGDPVWMRAMGDVERKTEEQREQLEQHTVEQPAMWHCGQCQLFHTAPCPKAA